jgi:hypothetical protein
MTLLNRDGTPVAGWVLDTAYSISEDGKITGKGLPQRDWSALSC